ncbi:hypothetical protein B0H11DRAFT_2000890 [Mycena galericulata]|nr:hypothetical protein B0H11DRAFT_2000890 [Mycena galericulata]
MTMSPCPSHGNDSQSPPENVQATTIATITSTPRLSHARKPQATRNHVITKTVDEIIIVVDVETVSASTGAQMGTDAGFVTSRSTLSTSPSATTSSSTTSHSNSAAVGSSSSRATGSNFTVSTSASSSSTEVTAFALSSAESMGSSVLTASSSLTSLKAVSGAKATLQSQGTAVNSDGSPTETGTQLQAGSPSSTSTPLKVSSTAQATPVGAIVGVAVAGVLVLALVILLLVLWVKRRSARAARNAGDGYEGGMRAQGLPITPFPTDLQPNRPGRVNGGDTALPSSFGGSQPTLRANPQYPFGPPIIVPPSPQRPSRKRGDTLSSVGFF